MIQALYISTTITFVLATLLVLVLRPVARTTGLVDIPNERKVHRGSVPLVGGIAIFCAVMIGHLVSLLFAPIPNVVVDYGTFYTAGGLLLIVGMIDDFRELSAWTRLTSEIVAALLIAVPAGAVVTDLGTLFSAHENTELGIIAVPFTIFAVVGLINAINMSDGLDGLAGSLTLVPVAGFIVAIWWFGTGQDTVFLACLAAGISGFLLFNVTVPGVRPALIFLGDSGSMFLGLALAWIAIRVTQSPDAVLSPAAVLWFLALPVYDIVCMTSRRIMRRRTPFTADKEHLHHVFLLAGFTVTETVLIMGTLSAVGVAVGLLGTYYSVSDRVLAGSFLIVGLLYFWMIVRAWSVMRFFRRSICRRRNMADRRQGFERRRRRNVAYKGPERRSGKDRRSKERRSADSLAERESGDRRSVDH